jgi:hypothetical protein
MGLVYSLQLRVKKFHERLVIGNRSRTFLLTLITHVTHSKRKN